MNREIKFRGFGEKWEYGHLVEMPVGVFIAVEPLMPRIEIDGEIRIPWIDGLILVDPDTVGQYTGLRDKNGKEIYEGDELVYNDWDSVSEDEFRNRGVVSYDHDSWGFVISNRQAVDMDCIDLKECEVIGNIHENPELLESN